MKKFLLTVSIIAFLWFFSGSVALASYVYDVNNVLQYYTQEEANNGQVPGGNANVGNPKWLPWTGTHWTSGVNSADVNYGQTAGYFPVSGYATWGYDAGVEALSASIDEVALLTTAFDWWDDVCGMSFGYAGDGMTGDIQITTDSLSTSPFILASAYNPADTSMEASGLGGDITFSDRVSWVEDEAAFGTNNQYDFFTDALHEIGHAIGIDHPYPDADNYPGPGTYDQWDHTWYPGGVMELYSKRGSGFQALSMHDIFAAQELYGPGTFTPYSELPLDYLYNGTVVPEPGTMILLGLGLLGLAGVTRKKTFS